MNFSSAVFPSALVVGAMLLTGQVMSAEEPIEPYADAERVASDTEDDATYPLIIERVTEDGGIDANLSATRTLDGQLLRRTYRLAADSEPRRAFAHYLNGLESAGYEVLFECDGETCGGQGFVQASPGHRVRAEAFDEGKPHYVAARRNRNGRDLYVAIQVAGADSDDDAAPHVQVDVLEVRPREVAAITVDAEEMARQLDASGHVALYGIYFDTDSARLKASSDPTLAEIVQLLDDRPEMRLLVVGHTDTRGGFDYNIDLSRRRAASVVDALTEDHGVDRERLKPWGVGFTAPAESNRSGQGRTQNRRVELVTW